MSRKRSEKIITKRTRVYVPFYWSNFSDWNDDEPWQEIHLRDKDGKFFMRPGVNGQEIIPLTKRVDAERAIRQYKKQFPHTKRYKIEVRDLRVRTIEIEFEE